VILKIVGLWSWLTITVTVVATITAFWKILERSLIFNDAVEAFVTIDPLASLTGGEPLVTYGPGVHTSFFWEQRSGKNVLNLGSSSEEFTGRIQCLDGAVTLESSFRMRPDIKRAPEYLSGLGSMAGEFSSIFQAWLVNRLSSRNVRDVLKGVSALNAALAKEFIFDANGNLFQSDLEKRYGLWLEDVTVSKVTADKQISETLGVQMEMDIIADAIPAFICKARGIKRKAYAALVANGEISPEEISIVRDRIMAASNNLQGMKLDQSTHVIDIRGLKDLSPEAAAAFAAIANRYTPPSPKKGTKKGDSSK
ncbi:MAG TPA: hypothetical protein PKD95_00915, partial [Candidatus Paceibacterota bacterium]|nr:hypothetical protein [Candidatus Paceibacterota bacterium]